MARQGNTGRSIGHLALMAIPFALGACASFDAVDRSAQALARNLESNDRCSSRADPDGQITASCVLWTSTSTTTTTTVTTTGPDGAVTTTSTTETVDGDETP